jgi:O-antigen/teichoic acid export membrane protein
MTDSENSATKPDTLRARAMTGSAWTMTQYAVNNVLRLGSNLVLAYALFPEAFALVAYAAIVIQGLEMLSDIGIGPAIVHSHRGTDPDFLNTAWTLQILRGILLFALSAAVAGPVAWFYGEPQLALIIPACGVSFIITGLQSTAVHTCSRSLNLRPIAIWGISEAILKAAITITWALVWPSVWALIWGAAISYAVGCVLTHTILPGIRNRLRWERAAVRTLLGFGGWVTASTMFTFLAGQSDRLILGKLDSMATVGVYSIALMFARLPYEIGSRLAQIVLFPALASVARDNRAALHGRMLESRGAILAVAQLGFSGFIACAPWFFELVYDPRYADAARYSPLLAGVVWVSLLQATADRGLLALGNARTLAWSNAVNLLVTVVACLAGYHLDGMRGFILGVGLGNLAGYICISRALFSQGLSMVGQDLRFSGVVVLSSFISLGMPLLLGPEFGDHGWRAAFTLLGISLSTAYAYHCAGDLAKTALSRFRKSSTVA